MATSLLKICGWVLLSLAGSALAAETVLPRTFVSIVGEDFYINGAPTYKDRQWQGHRIEGLLLNSRMVQATFDDQNPETVSMWKYPDTREWNPERNVSEFLAAMPQWRAHGLLCFTVNLQGGAPVRRPQVPHPWHNSAYNEDGSLRPRYLGRVERILRKADELGMAVIVGYFYFGQDERLKDEKAVITAVDNVTNWILERGFRNVLVEINNECNIRYEHDILKPDRVHELIMRVRNTERNDRRLYVGTSYGGGTIPGERVVFTSDFLLMHGNGVSDPNRISEMVRTVRKMPNYNGQPILFNEDDHFDFDKGTNNFVAAIKEHASWGYFDPGSNNYKDGYQSPPVNWGINTPLKQQFFSKVAEIAGAKPPPVAEKPPAVAARTNTPPQAAPAPAPSVGQWVRTNYHGWTDALAFNNGTVEVVVVPEIGRIMQFKFIDGEPVFWENPSLLGKPANPDSKTWVNFGGDKAWPSPQSSWPRIAERAWPPPSAFDARPVNARVQGTVLTLTSPVDRHYGIRVIRDIAVHPSAPEMSVTTRFEKVAGERVRCGVWVITQLEDPVGVYSQMPQRSKFAIGYNKQSQTLPANFRRTRDFIACTRDPAAAHKIGTDAEALYWIGKKSALRIHSETKANAEYPDYGSTAEIYTNPNPLKYVELELLGPLYTLSPGKFISQTSTYTLYRRKHENADTEAMMLFR